MSRAVDDRPGHIAGSVDLVTHDRSRPAVQMLVSNDTSTLKLLALEAQLRDLDAICVRRPENARMMEEAVESLLKIAKALLDANRLGHHGRVLSLRHLLGALVATDARASRQP